MVSAGIAREGEALIGFLDAGLLWNRADPFTARLEPLFERLNVNSVLYCRPAEPYRSILSFLARNSNNTIYPRDSETRTFLHDLPVIKNFDTESAFSVLKNRKCVLTHQAEIVSYGTVSPEQAYVTFSSVCFAGFVKFFSDLLTVAIKGNALPEHVEVFNGIKEYIQPITGPDETLIEGPFESEEKIYRAVEEAGEKTVSYGLVDSYFGNVSYFDGQILYISQTGSSLDELRGCIDPCPLDDSSCAPITASSELPAHLAVVRETGFRAILHGHPKFCVIMSMVCRVEDCEWEGMCHKKCPRQRFVADIPVVSGEVGAGAYGLCNTVPCALGKKPAVIVYGHGLFTGGRTDFNEPFHRMKSTENLCIREYVAQLEKTGVPGIDPSFFSDWV